MSTLSAPARPTAQRAVEKMSAGTMLHAVLLSLATGLVVMALAILPLLTPVWIHFAMAASGGQAEGATQAQSRALSDATVHELVFGPGTFQVSYRDNASNELRPLYGADEIGHMQDVRLVLWAFLAVAAVAAVILALTLVRRPRPATWRAVARGGAGLAVGLAVIGVFAALAFGVAFELFHRILFPAGNWAFDPAQSNLVRLYPLGFWQLSAAAYLALGVAGGALAWLLARRRAVGGGPAR